MTAFDTAEECTNKLGLKNTRQFYALISKSRSGIRKRYTIIIDKNDDEIIDDSEDW